MAGKFRTDLTVRGYLHGRFSGCLTNGMMPVMTVAAIIKHSEILTIYFLSICISQPFASFCVHVHLKVSKICLTLI